jgi:hypothetical protein
MATAMANPSALVRAAGFQWQGRSVRPRTTKTGSQPRKPEQGRSDSNAQPAVLETAALPIELHPYVVIGHLAFAKKNRTVALKDLAGLQMTNDK